MRLLTDALTELVVGSGEVIAEAHHPAVAAIDVAGDEFASLGAIDQFDEAVVLQQQVFGYVTDGWSRRPVVTADGEQQLVLLRCQTSRSGLLVAQCRNLRSAVRNRSRSRYRSSSRFGPAISRTLAGRAGSSQDSWSARARWSPGLT